MLTFTMSLTLRLPLHDAPVASVAAILDNPDGGGLPILFGHGSGVDMTHEFMADVAAALAERGHPVLRFRYPYMERMAQSGTRRPPDKFPELEKAHLAAAVELGERTGHQKPVFLGKSMACRVGANLAQRGVPCRGLAHLGYPLHPSGKPTKLRDDNFDDLVVPALFLAGTRDKLSDLDLLRTSLEKYAGDATLQIIEGANHGFQVLAKQGLTPLEVRGDLARRVHAWATAL